MPDVYTRGPIRGKVTVQYLDQGTASHQELVTETNTPFSLSFANFVPGPRGYYAPTIRIEVQEPGYTWINKPVELIVDRRMESIPYKIGSDGFIEPDEDYRQPYSYPGGYIIL